MDADRTLELIDGALDDYATGVDAMRWTPDPPSPVLPNGGTPDPGGWVADNEVIRLGIRWNQFQFVPSNTVWYDMGRSNVQLVDLDHTAPQFRGIMLGSGEGWT